MLRIWTNVLKAALVVPLAACACGTDSGPSADGTGGSAGIAYGTGGVPPGGFGGAPPGGSGGFGVAPTGGTSAGGISAGGVAFGGSGGGVPGGGTSTGGVPPAGAPAVSLSSNAMTLTEGQSVMFTALVNDPNGPQDIVGGTLTDATGAVTYGPFVAASAGAFSISVDWTKMNQVQPIEFKGQETRTFRADFVDREGNHGTATLTITLTCTTGAACAGSCVDLMTSDSHCGTCMNACASGGACTSGRCPPTLGACFAESNGFSNCDAYCASVGRGCVSRGCATYTEAGYASLSECNSLNATEALAGACSDPFVWAPSGDPIKRCCCS